MRAKKQGIRSPSSSASHYALSTPHYALEVLYGRRLSRSCPRKYRSATFEEVVGQEHIAQTLRNAIASGRIAHAYLFVGTRGGQDHHGPHPGQGAELPAPRARRPTPCDACDACLAITRGDDVDVIEIDGASNRGIDEIRELRENAIYRPARCRYKIYIIDEVHMLTGGLQRPVQDAGGAARAREVHLRHDRAAEGAGHDPLALPAVRLPQHPDAPASPSTWTGSARPRRSRPTTTPCSASPARPPARCATGCRCWTSFCRRGGQVTEDDVLRVLGMPSEEKTASIVAAVAAQQRRASAVVELDALLAAGITLESAVGAIGEMFRHMMLILVCGPDSDLVEAARVAAEERGGAGGQVHAAGRRAGGDALPDHRPRPARRDQRAGAGGGGRRPPGGGGQVRGRRQPRRAAGAAGGGRSPGPRASSPVRRAATGYRPVGLATDEKKRR